MLFFISGLLFELQGLFVNWFPFCIPLLWFPSLLETIKALSFMLYEWLIVVDWEEFPFALSCSHFFLAGKDCFRARLWSLCKQTLNCCEGQWQKNLLFRIKEQFSRFGYWDDSKRALELVMGKAGDVEQWHFILHYLQHPKHYLRK